jgi:hypothetical protein
MSEPKRSRLPALGVNPDNDQKALSKQQMIPDRLLETERMLHVCNAPSPAATSAIPIGKIIFDRFLGA